MGDVFLEVRSDVEFAILGALGAPVCIPTYRRLRFPRTLWPASIRPAWVGARDRPVVMFTRPAEAWLELELARFVDETGDRWVYLCSVENYPALFEVAGFIAV